MPRCSIGERPLQCSRIPNTTTASSTGLIETRGKGVVPDDRLEEARATIKAPLDRADIAAQMAHFFTERTIA